MNYLKNKRIYLSGPIEFGSGENWREAPKKVFSERFGIEVFDPYTDPKQNCVEELNKAKAAGDFNLVAHICHQFVRKDLTLVDRVDAVIAFLPYKVPTTGTVHEIVNSNLSKKPTLLVTDKDSIGYIPLWYFGFIPLEFMFAGWGALYQYLDKVDAGKETVNNRWDYVHGKI